MSHVKNISASTHLKFWHSLLVVKVLCYLDEGLVPEARLQSDDCITVQAPQRALYDRTNCPTATGLSTKKEEELLMLFY